MSIVFFGYLNNALLLGASYRSSLTILRYRGSPKLRLCFQRKCLLRGKCIGSNNAVVLFAKRPQYLGRYDSKTTFGRN